MASKAANEVKVPKKLKEQEEILKGFQQLREDQRAIAKKLSDFEADQNEHRMVIETLKQVDGERKCYRLLGGVLTERQVKDVLPELIVHKERIDNLIEKVNESLIQKGKDIFEYKKKHNIVLQDAFQKLPMDKEKSEKEDKESTSKGPLNVLVS